MKPAARELFRAQLLRQLDEVTPNPLRTAALAMLARASGFIVTEEECTAELHYLADKDLVERPAKTISPEVAEWRITAAGRDHVAQAPL